MTPPPIPILDRDNPIHREALWTAHQESCAYCNRVLGYSELEIDHIIPTHLRQETDKFLQCLRMLGLPADYNLHSLDNLLPAHGRCNRDKGGKLRDESFLRHFRTIASDKLPKFASTLERLAKQRVTEKAVAACITQVAKGRVTLEQVYDLAFRTVPFDPGENYQDADFVRLTSPRVRIDCQLPSVQYPGGTALVTFRPVELRGVQIEVDHDLLTRELFRGLGAPPDPQRRPFIFDPPEAAAIQQLRFGTATVTLEREEVAQFCQLIDRLAPIYTKAFCCVEAAFNGMGTALVSPGLYEVAQLPLTIWEQLSEFVSLHDLAKGDSGWHIFDAPPASLLKVIQRQPDSWDYRCFLDAVVVCPSAAARSLPFMWTSLRWSAANNRPEPPRSARQNCWSVAEACAFVHDRLIPKVIRGDWLSALAAAIKPNDGGKKIHRRSGYRELSIADFSSQERALDSIEKMQPRYLLDHKQFVKPTVVESAFLFLQFLHAASDLPPWSVEYISEKLGCHLEGVPRDPAEFVAQILRTLQHPESAEALAISVGSVVDDALRSVLEILRKGTPAQTLAESWPGALRAFEPVVRDYNERNYLARMRGEDFDAA
jgi:5-methylcytosine-specific restriction endonuclease McrA